MSVSSEEYAEFIRYKQSVAYELGAISVSDESHINKIRHSTGPRATLNICGSNVKLMIDTEAPVNVIDEPTFESLQVKPEFYGYTATKLNKA